MHLCYFILQNSKLKDHLEDIDILALMLGSIGHDIDHPGLNNLYLQKTKHIYAMPVNDQAILEHYHSYNLFHLLSRPENNILENLSPNDNLKLRKMICEGILGTDMSQHFGMIAGFNKLIERKNNGENIKDKVEDRIVRNKIITD